MPGLKTKGLFALKVFQTVARVGSLSVAARELSLSTASVFGYTKDLEAAFEAPLFTRQGKKLVLTPSGESLRERAAGILQGVDDLHAAARSMSAGVSGKLRVHTQISCGYAFVVPALQQCLAANPQLHFRLSMTDDWAGNPDLNTDVFILNELPDVKTLVSRKILTSRMAICASPQYIKRRGEPTSHVDLEVHDCITSSVVRGSTVWRLRDAGGTHTVRPHVAVQTTDWHAMYKLALQGNGLVMVPLRYSQKEIASGQLVTVLGRYECAPSATADFRENVWVLFHRTRHKAPRVRAFLDQLIAFIQAQPEPGAAQLR